MSLMTADTSQVEEVLAQALAPEETLYAILDAARHSDVPNLLVWAGVEHECLYTDETRENLWYVAPYLLKCEPASDFFRLLLRQGWGGSWGIFLTSAADLQTLLKHSRQFLVVKGEDDKDFYFRFYDPRVLRAYLPTCTVEEIKEFFGPIRCFLMEAEDPASLLKFTAGDQGSNLEIVPLQSLATEISS